MTDKSAEESYPQGMDEDVFAPVSRCEYLKVRVNTTEVRCHAQRCDRVAKLRGGGLWLCDKCWGSLKPFKYEPPLDLGL